MLREAVTVATHAVEVGSTGGRRLERDVGVVLAVPVVADVLADERAADTTGLTVVGAHEGDLTGVLDDIDGDRGNVAVGGADLR